MISLAIPKIENNLYVELNSAIIGPILLDNSPIADFSLFRSTTDVLSEAKGRYHENYVNHHEIKADITYEPIIPDITPFPTSMYPDQVKWKCFTSSNLQIERTVTCGIGYHGAVAIVYGTATIDMYAYDRAAANKLIVYKLQSYVASASQQFATCTKTEYTFISKDTNNLTCARKVYVLGSQSTPTLRSGDWSKKRSFLDVVGACEANISSSGSSQSNQLVALRRRFSLPAIYPDEIRSYVDTFVQTSVENSSFPLELEHYGDLAMEAARKVNATNVNVLALLRDLRNPLEMIPKLKNLYKLKNVADDFLTIDYGLLPTVSDLQDIFGAFQRLKPYLDRYGFATYNACHQDSTTIGLIDYSLEQRIKLAIGNEDSTLISILNKIDSIGVAPTFENIWDLIPFSFVIDWFIDIGDFLERVDTRLRLLRWDIKYATLSYKQCRSTVIKPSPVCPIFGTVESVSYKRWTLGQCPTPPLSFQDNSQDLSTHWLEGGALLAQRLK